MVRTGYRTGRRADLRERVRLCWTRMDGTVIRLAEAGDGWRLGGKVEGLRWLAANGFAVPATWVVTHLPDDPSVLHAALAGVVRDGAGYAVRSSANVEDGGSVSYAGQFLSELGVQGIDGVAAAVARVVASARGEGIRSYRRHTGDDRPIEMAVIVQEMIEPVCSGVAFSKNPITGMNESVVEAVVGSGESLMAGGTTPDRWVQRWGDYVETPPAATVSEDVVSEVVATVHDMAARYGSPIDVEWVYDGATLWWVQIRPITGIDDITIYSRRISKEVMPGIIKPLVWSVNVPMVNRAWVDLFVEALGEVDVAPEDLARSFGYRSYFNMSAIGEIFAALGMPRESLELLLGLPAGSRQPKFKPTAATFRKTPRLLRMAVRQTRYGARTDEAVERLRSDYQRFASHDLASTGDDALLADIAAMRTVGIGAARLNIVVPLLANIFTAVLRGRLAKRRIDLESVDLMDGFDGGDAFDPNPHLEAIADQIRSLDPSTREAALRDGYDALPPSVAEAVDRFLDRFGHFSDSGNDFSVPNWREQPDTVVKVAAQRTARAAVSERRTWQEATRGVPGWQRPLLDALRTRAQTYVRRRDAVSSTYTYGYGLFRRYFLELGARLVERNVIDAADDVMYLTFEELEAAVEGTHGDFAALVAARKREIAAVADLHLPDVIYGDDFIPRPADDGGVTAWHGTATARGHHSGRVCIVGGLADFDKVQEGDVIAIPFSDVGWTPLFDKAGAVVAEAGGLLSHSSIVAREYGIPCVVSVEGAMRMPEGATVTVDGYRGVVVLEDER